jgi:hypothetical protein
LGMWCTAVHQWMLRIEIMGIIFAYKRGPAGEC